MSISTMAERKTSRACRSISPTMPRPLTMRASASTRTAPTAPWSVRSSGADLDSEDTLHYAITGGNTDGAFTIDPDTGQITVANSAALDFETTQSFTLTVVAIDNFGAYDEATVTVELNNLDEAGTNDAPENTIPADRPSTQDGMLLFSSATGTALSISDFDAGSNEVQVTLTATNGALNLSGTRGLISAPVTVPPTHHDLTGTMADINGA